MKKVLKFVKGKRDGTPSQSGEAMSPGGAQTPEEEGFSGVENGYGYSVDFGGKDKSLTKLHKAAWQGNLDKLKSALKKVEVDAVDRRNRTALHFAVAQGHPNIVWFLLGNNAKTSICDDEGHSPLLKAIECGHKECTSLLLDRGADVNVADYTGNTGLHIAVARASLDTASALLKKAAETELANNAGDYPLHIATRLESKDLVDLLLAAGASVDVPDRENRTPLMLAAKAGNRVLARLFVDRGAQLTVVDSNGWTAHDYAMLAGHKNIASELSKHSDAPSDDNGETDPGDGAPATPTPKGLSLSDESSAREPPPDASHGHDDSPESPDAEAIPPYCRPPRSWQMIQAGMIDRNNDGVEPKRRSITALGTLHSRRESFADPPPPSPKSTLSLNRRRPSKQHNAFAKHRFSLNEAESLAHWPDRKNEPAEDSDTTRAPDHSTSGSDWDSSASADNWRQSRKNGAQSPDSHEIAPWSESSGSGTLGRRGTMQGVEELWVVNPHLSPENSSRAEKRPASWDSDPGSPHPEKTFPPPPTGLELGVDMAKSIRCIRGLSVDQPSARSTDRSLWKNAYESHSLDCLDERDGPDGTRPHADFKCHKPPDRPMDVSRRINEQLECYDQALRELAESSRKRERGAMQQNYYSLPCKGGGREEWRRMSCRGLGGGEEVGEEGRAERRRKRHMLLAMREVKHAVEVAKSLKTSTEERMPSPLGKAEDGVESDGRGTPKEISSSSGGNSPADENPFFGIGQQETVLERKDAGRESEESGTGEESTLWLQDEAHKKDDSDEDVAEMADFEERSKHGAASSFSPLGVIQREMEAEEEESRGHSRAGRGPQKYRRPSPAEEPLSGENEEQNDEVLGEQSPDVSLSSGPIEPLGAEKDSGSEPESSHNDVSPAHNYVLKSQHEWLKSHLKAATSEKNKLEELTAQLAEKAERLQYELADAREAGKSRDEVIQLLQGQLARMEAAYTKSLEESVQSRLQLTCHEQEILHLKELCYRYQEEKEAAAGGVGGEFLQELQLRVKVLEEEKEKMKEEISQLEEEKSVLERRVRTERRGESEMMEQCQRWKERCGKLEEMVRGYDSKEAAYESYVREKDGELAEQERQLRRQKSELERQLMEAREENVELKTKVESAGVAVERERRRAREAEREKEELMAELRRRKLETESDLRRVEKEMEEKMVRKLKEKEEEVGGLVAQLNRERESLMAGLGSVRERAGEEVGEMQMKKEGSRVRGEWGVLLESRIVEMQNAWSEELGAMVRENVKLKKEVEEVRAELDKERRRGRWGKEGKEEEEEEEEQEQGEEGEGELAWSRLYGMQSRRRRKGMRERGRGREEGGLRAKGEGGGGQSWEGNILGEISVCQEQVTGVNRTVQDLEFLELKKQILSLESRMTDEKNLRHALENEMIKMRVNLSEKENLEIEVDSLKKKVDKQWLGRSGMELLEYERNLQAKLEKYLAWGNGAPPQQDDYKAKCQLLAKEREKSKQLTKSLRTAPKPSKTFPPSSSSSSSPPPPPPPPPTHHTHPHTHSQPPQLLLHPPQLALHPRLKNDLDYQLDKSIHKYIQESASVPSVSNTQTIFTSYK